MSKKLQLMIYDWCCLTLVHTRQWPVINDARSDQLVLITFIYSNIVTSHWQIRYLGSAVSVRVFTWWWWVESVDYNYCVFHCLIIVSTPGTGVDWSQCDQWLWWPRGEPCQQSQVIWLLSSPEHYFTKIRETDNKICFEGNCPYTYSEAWKGKFEMKRCILCWGVVSRDHIVRTNCASVRMDTVSV